MSELYMYQRLDKYTPTDINLLYIDILLVRIPDCYSNSFPTMLRVQDIINYKFHIDLLYLSISWYRQ
jgi:hypothetical protein